MLNSMSLTFKTLAFSLVMIMAGTAYGQQIKNCHLDSLIWKEINNYRISLGVSPVTVFDTGQLRTVSYRLTDLNASRPTSEFDHTRGPNHFVGYNAECIYCYEISGHVPAKYLDGLDESELQELAKQVVNAWIKSPDHNYLIASELVKTSTITTVIEITDHSFRLVVSYHDLWDI